MVAQFVDGYQEEYAKAWRASDQPIALLLSQSLLKIQKIANGISRFLLTVSGVSPDKFVERALEQGVLLPHAKPGTGICQMQVNPTILRARAEQLASILGDAVRI